MPKPVFNEENHTYTTPDGRPLAGVTSVLGEFRRVTIGCRTYGIDLRGNVIDGDVLNRAADFGKAVHSCLEYTLTLGPDGFDYPDRLAPVVKQINQWRLDYQPEIVAVELALYDPALLIAGTMDIVCRIKGKLSIVDAKTGEGALTGPQTAAYERLYRVDTGTKEQIDRYKLRLPKDGSKYQFIKLNNAQDWPFFQASLFRFNYLKSMGVTP